MNQKLVLKRLSLDDLAFFKYQALTHNIIQTNGIKLNRRILVDELYPSLPEILENKQNLIMMTVNIHGPGYASKYMIQRKLQKGLHHNYRLNGAFIADPESDPERFHTLQSGDFVIFDFMGDLEPYSVTAIFIARALIEDAQFHKALDSRLGSGRKSMLSLSPQELEKLISLSQLSEYHPAHLLILEASLEDAALGGVEGLKVLRSGPFKGKVSRQTLEQARKTAQKTGRLGEEFIFDYLTLQKQSDLIRDFRWEADDNAISPYDFAIEELDGTTTLVDVKSTRGNFDNRIHISYNELLQMQDASRYDLYRVFEMSEDSAQLRIAQNVKAFAEKIVEILQQLPFGIHSDGVSFQPTELDFGDPKEIALLEEEE